MAKMPCFYTGCPYSYLQYNSPFSLIFSFPLLSLLPLDPVSISFSPSLPLSFPDIIYILSFPSFFLLCILFPLLFFYSSFPSIRNVLVYFPRSYLTLLAFTNLSYIYLRLFSIVVFLFRSYFHETSFSSFSPVPAFCLISSGFRYKFFLFLYLYILCSGNSACD
jgi:hypothetical protein